MKHRPKKKGPPHSRAQHSAPVQDAAAAQPPPNPRSGFHVEHAIGLAIVLGTLVVYARACSFEFVNFDDTDFVMRNPRVQSGLTGDNLVWDLTSLEYANWHPATWVSLQFDATLFGMKPYGFHFSNIVLHAANAWLLFHVLRRMTGAVYRPAVVAALFALHPLHVESVAWVTERKDVLSTFFGMLTLWAYDAYVRRMTGFTAAGLPYLLALGAYALSLMAKPMLVTLPFLLLLLDYWPLGRWPGAAATRNSPPGTDGKDGRWKRFGRLAAEKIPFLALAMVSSFLTVIAQEKGGAVSSAAVHAPFPYRVMNAVVAYAVYLRKTVWPADLMVFYQHSGTSIASWTVAVAGLILLAFTVTAIWQAQRRPYLLVGWLWYLGTLLPVIGIVQVGGQALADRYSYVPLIGVFVMAVWGVVDLTATWQRRRAVLAWSTAAVLALCSICTWVQIGYWRDNYALWEHALAVEPENSVVNTHIAAELVERGRKDLTTGHSDLAAEKFDLAVEHYATALRANPNNNFARYGIISVLFAQNKLAELLPYLSDAVARDPQNPDTHHSLGIVLERLEHPREALAEFEEALLLNPQSAPTHLALGQALANRGRWEDAEKHLDEARQLRPDFSEAHYQRGLLYSRRGQWDEAIGCFRAAVAGNPHSNAYRCDLAHALHAKGRTVEARAEYQEARRLDPEWLRSSRQRAWELATNADPNRRRPERALQLAEQVCEAVESPEVEQLDTLAAAQAAMGEFNRAVATAKAAAKLAAETGNEQRAEPIRKRLQLYERHEAYSESR